MSSSGCSAEGLEAFALRVIGDSMAPEFLDGHIIIVDPACPLLNGVYAVVVNNQEILFGQYIQEETSVWLHYLNPEFDPVELADNFVLKGVITQRNGRKRKDVKHYNYS